MNILELRNLIAGMPDNAEVIIWVNDENNPADGCALNVQDSHRSGMPDSDPDQDCAVHLTVLF